MQLIKYYCHSNTGDTSDGSAAHVYIWPKYQFKKQTGKWKIFDSCATNQMTQLLQTIDSTSSISNLKKS